jgi:hypothetical protein
LSDQKKYKRFQSPQNWFFFEYPDHWEMLVVEGIPAFFDPNDTGVLQIYSLEHQVDLADSELELKNYLGIQNVEFNEDLVARFENAQGTKIVSCEFKIEDRHWAVYSIANKRRLILATFNSDTNISDSLYAELTRIVSTIQFPA